MASLPKRLFFEPGDCSGGVGDGEGIPERLEDTHGHHDNGLANSSDQDYFQSYSDIHIHETMLADHVRTNTYRWAILKNYPLFYEKVVLDVGAGTGILSMFAVQAGARRVYAVEASQLANQLSAIVRENKMADRISVIHGKIEDVVLPEKVDVIVSEWMGYFLLYESMLNSVIYARDKWLKPEGVMMPSSATLFLAPISDEDYQDRLMFWRTEVKDMYKVSMETIIPLARRNISQTVTVKSVSPEAVQSHAQVVCKLDLRYVKEADLKNIEKNFHFSCFGGSELNGFLAWFEVEFPQKIVLSTSPYRDETHWQQAVMYFDEPASVRQDTIISGCVKISPNSNKSRFLDISLQFAIGEGSFTQKIYHMNDIMS